MNLNFVLAMILLIWLLLGNVFGLKLPDKDAVAKEGLKKIFGEDENSYPEYEVISPLKLNEKGMQIKIVIRSEDAHLHEATYFNITAFGTTFAIHLQKSLNMIASDIKISKRYSDNNLEDINTNSMRHCFYQGSVISHSNAKAVFTICDELYGFIKTPTDSYFIQPIPVHNHKRSLDLTNNYSHVIYKYKKTHERVKKEVMYAVDYLNKLQQNFVLSTPSPRLRAKYGYPFGQDYSGPPNAARAETLTVETAIFVDKLLTDYLDKLYPLRGIDAHNRYILTIMHGINLLYNDPSYIGKEVKFVIMKLEYFQNDNVGFIMTNSSDDLMRKFCDWQMSKNQGNDYDDKHWDHAFFFTGIDMLTYYKDGHIGDPLGVAPVGGMCTIKNSCTVTEGKTFTSVYTGAHEAGHNFGLPHDGEKNDCPKYKNIMAPMNVKGAILWSSCSREFALKYLLLPWTVCLLDSRSTVPEWDPSGLLPGQRYDIEQQCKHVLGEGASHHPRQPLDTICIRLACIKNGNTLSLHPAMEGTECTIGKWCRRGECVPK